jgi:phage gp46-like protein
MLLKDLDISISSDADRDLATVIEISLLTKARAHRDDDVQDPTDLGGWWGDSYPDVPGDSFGSRLWTLAGRSMPTALKLAPDMVREALQWAIEDGLILDVQIAAETAGPGVLGISVRPVLLDGKIGDTYGPWYISAG